MIKRRSLKISCGQEWPDIVQEAKLKCLSFMEEDFYQAYLYRTINNLALNFLKKREQMSSVFADPNQNKMENLDELLYEIDFGAVYDVSEFMRACWNQEERDAIYGFFTRNSTLLDCAEVLEMSPTTVQRWMQAVKGKFQEELGAYAVS